MDLIHISAMVDGCSIRTRESWSFQEELECSSDSVQAPLQQNNSCFHFSYTKEHTATPIINYPLGQRHLNSKVSLFITEISFYGLK